MLPPKWKKQTKQKKTVLRFCTTTKSARQSIIELTCHSNLANVSKRTKTDSENGQNERERKRKCKNTPHERVSPVGNLNCQVLVVFKEKAPDLAGKEHFGSKNGQMLTRDRDTRVIASRVSVGRLPLPRLNG